MPWVPVVRFQFEGPGDYGENGKQSPLDGSGRLRGNDYIRVCSDQEYCLEKAGYAREFTDRVDGGKLRSQEFSPLPGGRHFASEPGRFRLCIRHVWCCWRNTDFLAGFDSAFFPSISTRSCPSFTSKCSSVSGW